MPAATAHYMLAMYVQFFCLSCTFTHSGPIKDQQQRVDKTVLKLMQELKEDGRVEVNIKPVYIFLFKDGGSLASARCTPLLIQSTGTVISIHLENDLKFTEPIRRRLMQRDTGLRATADASFLVHGLLDLSPLTRLSLRFSD